MALSFVKPRRSEPIHFKLFAGAAEKGKALLKEVAE
jgi:hypothetical protein